MDRLVFTKEQNFIDIADVIREKLVTSAEMKPTEMAGMISSLVPRNYDRYDADVRQFQ